MAQSDSWTVMRYELTPNLNDIHMSRHIIVPESCIHQIPEHCENKALKDPFEGV